MKYCSQCGGQNDDNAAFCTFCGAKAAEPLQANNSAANSVDRDFGWQSQPPNNPQFIPPAPQAPQQVSSMSILALVLGIIAIPLACFFSPLGALGLPALILGIFSRIRNTSGNNRNSNIAVAAIITGALALVIAIVGSIYFFGTGFYQETYFGR